MRLTILTAFLVGLIYSFYHWAIPNLWQVKPYSPLVLNQNSPSFTVDETNAYAPEAREIMDGNYWPSDFFIWEYKHSASPFKSDLVPALIMGGFSKLAGGVDKGFILADFIMPVLSFLSLYYFIYLLTKKPYIASAGALLTMEGVQYLSYFPYLPSVLKIILTTLSKGNYSHFIRSYHPQTTFPLFMLWVLLLWEILKYKNTKTRNVWFLGVSLGILFYTYIYYWTFALAWIGLIILWSGYKKNFKLLKKLSIALGLSLAIAAPIFIELLKFRLNPLNHNFGSSYEFLPPLDLKMLILVIGLIAASLLFIKNRQQKFFWVTLFSTSLGLFFSVHLFQIKIDDPVGHWLSRVVFPLGTILLFIIAVQKIKKHEKILGIGLSLLLLLYQARIHWLYFKNNAHVFQIESARLEAFKWFNQNTPKDSVILTSSLTDNIYLPVYTHNNVFIPFSYLSLAPSAEREERFFIVHKALGISKERVKSMLSLNENNIQLMKQKRFNFDDCGGHYLYYRQYTGADFYNCSVPSNKLEKIVGEYQIINPNLKIWKQKYRMDYWLWGPYEEKWAQVSADKMDNFELLWENQNYKIYALN